MTETAPNLKKIAMISAGVGLVAFLIGLIGWDYRFIGAFFFGLFIALIVAAILWFMGLRDGEAEVGQTHTGAAVTGASTSTPSATADPVPSTQDRAAGAAAVAAPVTTSALDEVADGQVEQATAPEAVATPESTSDATPEPAPTLEPTPAPAVDVDPTAAAKVKPGTILPGEQELSERKGEWKYAPEADQNGTAPVEVPVSSNGADAAPADDAIDRDGDGIIEGTNEGAKPATLTAAREGGPDDLKQIKGVGPKMEGLLHSMGFYHFDQIAAWTSDEVAWVDANLQGFKGRVSRDNWVAQAKILASGEETEFSKKVQTGTVY